MVGERLHLPGMPDMVVGEPSTADKLVIVIQQQNQILASINGILDLTLALQARIAAGWTPRDAVVGLVNQIQGQGGTFNVPDPPNREERRHPEKFDVPKRHHPEKRR